MLAHGFLRIYCDVCGHGRLVAFSCKGRVFCTPCGGRRMADTAAHLVDRVLPEVPIRQWVLTLPYPLHYRCAWNARLTSEVLRCFLRSVFADQRRRARALFGIRKGQCGSVTFIAGIRGQITLVALRDIAVGEEITFDYAMSDGCDYDEFDCGCAARKCRGRITGEDGCKPELIERYRGYRSSYLDARLQGSVR